MASGFRVRFTKRPTPGTRGVRGEIGTQRAMTTPGAASLDTTPWIYLGKPSPANAVVHTGARAKLPKALTRGKLVPMPPSSYPFNSPPVESQLPGFSQAGDETPFIQVVRTPVASVQMKRPTPPAGTRPAPTGNGGGSCNTIFGGK